jgi:hypothetical protein
VLTCERRRPALPHDAPTGELLAGLARRRPPPPCGSERPLLASYSGKPLALEDPSKKILGGCSRHGTRPPPPPPPPPPPGGGRARPPPAGGGGGGGGARPPPPPPPRRSPPQNILGGGGRPGPPPPPPPPPPLLLREASTAAAEGGGSGSRIARRHRITSGWLSFPRRKCVCVSVSARLLAPFPKTKSVRSIHHRSSSVSSNVNPPHHLALRRRFPAHTSQPHTHLSSPKSPWVLCTCPTHRHSGLLQQSLWVWGSPSLASHRHHHTRLHSDAMLLATARSMEGHAARRAPCHTATER